MSGTRLGWGLLILSITTVILAFGWRGFPPPSADSAGTPVAPPMPRSVPSFVLTDQKGQPFASDRLLGKVWIADFIFTSCAGSCPLMTAQMKKLQGALPEQVHLVSISVDPERDTPEVLTRYAQRAQADTTRWHFLTGESPFIQRLAKEGFLLSVAEGGPVEEPIVHSVRLVLVDPNGGIQGYYDGQEIQAVERLIKDAQRLAQTEEAG